VKEAAITDYRVLIDALADALGPLTNEPYALFGHSMGAFLAYELARRFSALGLRQPQCLFVSGRQAPHLFRSFLPRPVRELSDAEFIQAFPRLGGDMMGALSDRELAQLLIPALRADVAVCESYEAVRRPPLAIPIVALGGDADPAIPQSDLEPWSEHTTKQFSLHILPGEHFFVLTAASKVQSLVVRHLFQEGNGT
jgi:medium-chain acyl-[acyl-carrier-protein] hydrolase